MLKPTVSIMVRFSIYIYLSISKIQVDITNIIAVICQLRLDFDEFKLVQPTNSKTLTPTNCEFDSIKISGPSGRSPPETCGTLTGSHSMY